MKKIKAEKLSLETFKDFGTYADFLEPSGPRLGDAPCEFYRDMLIQTFETSGSIAYSVCKVGQRPLIIAETENHFNTGEAMLPLDGDVIMHVGPASKAPDYEKYRAFHVPKGTLIIFRPGVWHHAPFVTGDKPVNLLVGLPEMTYAKDCYVIELKGEDRIEIEK